MIIDCPYCDARVDAEVVATYVYPHGDDEMAEKGYAEEVDFGEDDLRDPYQATLLRCILCDSILLGYQTFAGTWEEGVVWSELKRVYPPERRLDEEIPENIRELLEEARRGLKSDMYRSVAVQCGCAIEALCARFHPGGNLEASLIQLKRLGVIDAMLFDWARELRVHRNIGAHADTTPISKQDAEDLYEFALATCQYVFILRKRFEDFKSRRELTRDAVGRVQ